MSDQPYDRDRFSLPDEIPQEVWRTNYFNYFTEVEEHFQRARGTALFLLSPLDWALVESWKNAGIPLEAVLRGIDAAFEKWRTKKSKAKVQAINSLTYCAQAVMTEAQILSGAAPQRAPVEDAGSPFESDELKRYLSANAEQIRATGEPAFDEIARALDRLAGEAEKYRANLEELEQRLTALEEKMIALAKTRQPEEQSFQHRQELDLQLRPYRRQMDGPQIALLEKQFLERKLLENAKLPRLSLFYLH